MGLDQYLKAKTNSVKHKPSTGACGGLFPLAPADNGTTEIGYWRKAYAVSSYLRNTLEIDDDFNLEYKEISCEKVLEIIEYATNLLNENAFEYEYEKRDWQDVVTAFTKAKWMGFMVCNWNKYTIKLCYSRYVSIFWQISANNSKKTDRRLY